MPVHDRVASLKNPRLECEGYVPVGTSVAQQLYKVQLLDNSVVQTDRSMFK